MTNPLTVTVDSLTLGELAAIEEITGLTIQETIDGFRDGLIAESAQFLLALVLVAGVREQPGFTLEDATGIRFVDFADQEQE